MKVADLTADDLSDEAIATLLSVSVRTFRYEVLAIMRVPGTRSRFGAGSARDRLSWRWAGRRGVGMHLRKGVHHRVPKGVDPAGAIQRYKLTAAGPRIAVVCHGAAVVGSGITAYLLLLAR